MRRSSGFVALSLLFESVGGKRKEAKEEKERKG